MENYLLAEVQAACNALGSFEDDRYHKDPDCIETVKDLIRFLKREGNYCEVRRFLGECQVVSSDLIPILKFYNDDSQLLDTVIRLLVNLTQPAISCFENEMPTEKTILKHYIDIEERLQDYKEAFCDQDTFSVLAETLQRLMSLDWDRRMESDNLLMERILILIRNILFVQYDSSRENRTEDDANVHDQLLWVIHSSGMEDLLLFIACSDEHEQYCMHVLEIISLMFREQTPLGLIANKSVENKREEESELARIRAIEEDKKKQIINKFGARHGRFNGTVVLKNFKSLSDNDLIVHKNLKNFKDFRFDDKKNVMKVRKNRQPIKGKEVQRRSTLSIRMFLTDFCNQFLENGYNILMHNVKKALARSKAQENDDTYFLWCMRFFMEYGRLSKSRFELIAETINMQAFHFVETRMISYHESILADKKEAKTWSKRLHLALKAYSELLKTLAAMSASNDAKVKRSAKILKSSVFYVMEFRDVFLLLLRNFDESKQSRVFLKDIIEATHNFLRMLESFCKNGNMVVERTRKKRSRKKKKKKEIINKPLEDIWSDISTKLEDFLFEREILPEGDDVVAFDAAISDVEEQKRETTSRIKKMLMKENCAEAIKIWKLAKEFWPEDMDEFGELNILKEILMSDIPVVFSDVEQDDDDDVNEEEMEQQIVIRDEVSFQFSEFANRFANSRIVKSYSILLNDWKTNSLPVNHAILKMLHRISYDANLPGLLFHSEIIRIFDSFFQDPSSKRKEFAEMSTFAKHITRKFIDVIKKDSNVIVELFFWQSNMEALDLVEGRVTSVSRNSKKVKVAWTSEEEDELRNMYENLKDEDDGKDIVDKIVQLLPGRSRTRRQVLRQLVHMGLMNSAKDCKGQKVSSKRTWSNEEEDELIRLYEENKNSDDIMGSIMDLMRVKRSRKNIVDKLLALDLISNKNEVKKKKVRRRKKTIVTDDNSDNENIGGRNFEDNLVDSESDEESEEEISESIEDLVRIFIRRSNNAQTSQCGLNWINKSILRAISDRKDDDEPEPIAIIPLNDDEELALEDENFTKLLKRIGLRKPDMVQERYWRIPVNITIKQLEEIANRLKIEPSSSDEEDEETFKESQQINFEEMMRKRNLLIDDSDDDDIEFGKFSQSRIKKQRIGDVNANNNDNSSQAVNFDMSDKENHKDSGGDSDFEYGKISSSNSTAIISQNNNDTKNNNHDDNNKNDFNFKEMLAERNLLLDEDSSDSDIEIGNKVQKRAIIQSDDEDDY